VAHNFVHGGNIIGRQKGRYAFNVFDEKTKTYLVENGIDVALGNYVLVTSRVTGLEVEMKDAVAAGNRNVVIAETLDELAAKMNVDIDAFRETVKSYNKLCKKQHDEAFAKGPRYLRPVATPSFYAIKVCVAFLTTVGGIKINEKTEVLDDEERARGST